MRPVISVSLNGRAYQLEDDAHQALASYLDGAARVLAANPDRNEILADLEQAIADKCGRFLSAHKTVIARAEIDQVIREMGPVEPGEAVDPTADRTSGGEGAPSADAGGESSGSAETEATAAKRLYQISDGAMISGVCKGVAVYLDADVTVIRLLFVLAAVLTGGLAILVYIAMMFLVPYANTPEEHAAARGLPFNARVLVEQAKLKAAQFADAAAYAAMRNGTPQARAQWKAEWRRARAQWRREWRHEWRCNRAQWRQHWRAHPWAAAGAAPPVPPAYSPPLARLICGLIWIALGLIGTLATVLFLLALFSLLITGAIFGWMPLHLQLWIAVACLVIAYLAVISPLYGMRYALRPQLYSFIRHWYAFVDGLIGLALLLIAAWYFMHHGQDLRTAFHTLQQNAQPAWQQLQVAWHTLVHGAH